MKDDKGLVQLAGELRFALVSADRRLSNELIAENRNPKLERAAILDALSAVSAFVKDALDGHGTLCLGELGRRLEDASVGHISPLFKGPPTGRPPNTRATNVWQAVAAAAVQAKMDTNVREKPAAKWVSEKLAKVKITVEPKQLLNWRDKFMRGHTGPGSDWYEKMLHVGSDEDSPLERADSLIRCAVMMYAGDGTDRAE